MGIIALRLATLGRRPGSVGYGTPGRRANASLRRSRADSGTARGSRAVSSSSSTAATRRAWEGPAPSAPSSASWARRRGQKPAPAPRVTTERVGEPRVAEQRRGRRSESDPLAARESRPPEGPGSRLAGGRGAGVSGVNDGRDLADRRGDGRSGYRHLLTGAPAASRCGGLVERAPVECPGMTTQEADADAVITPTFCAIPRRSSAPRSVAWSHLGDAKRRSRK